MFVFVFVFVFVFGEGRKVRVKVVIFYRHWKKSDKAACFFDCGSWCVKACVKACVNINLRISDWNNWPRAHGYALRVVSDNRVGLSGAVSVSGVKDVASAKPKADQKRGEPKVLGPYGKTVGLNATYSCTDDRAR